MCVQHTTLADIRRSSVSGRVGRFIYSDGSAVKGLGGGDSHSSAANTLVLCVYGLVREVTL